MLNRFHLPKLIGHRGACGYAPENTLASLYKAAQIGVTWVEFDVMLTQDGEAIIFHDETLDRTTNGTGLVAEISYAEIKKLDAGVWFSQKFTREKIPSFIEYLHAAYELGLGINVEIKPAVGRERETAEKVVEILQQHWPDTAIPPLVSSFSIEALKTTRAKNKKIYIGLLIDEWFDGWQEIAIALECVSAHVNHQLLDAKKVREIKNCVSYVLSYTVEDVERAAALFEMGVDSLFSNKPDVLKC